MNKIILFFSAIIFSNLAYSQTYFSIGEGKTFSPDLEDLTTEILENDFSIEDSNFKNAKGSSLSLGHSVNDFLDVRLTYISGVDFEYEFQAATVDVDAEMRIETYELSGLAKLPLSEKVDLYFILGFHQWDTELELCANSTCSKSEDDGSDITYGVGTSFNLGENLFIRIQWQSYSLDGEMGENLSARLGVMIN